MSAPTVPPDTVCGCGRALSCHYADMGRMRGPDCQDFHLVCDRFCRHPVLRAATTVTPVVLGERIGGAIPTSKELPVPPLPARLRRQLPDAAPEAASAPSARALDRLDPVCRCGDRRTRHVQRGTATPCRRCGCRNFTPEVSDVPAAPPGPTPVAAATPGPTPADNPAPVDLAAEAARAVERILSTPAKPPTARPAEAVTAKSPRRPSPPTPEPPASSVRDREPAAGAATPAAARPPRHDAPRPAAPVALVDPAVVGGDGAGEEVAAAAVGRAAATVPDAPRREPRTAAKAWAEISETQRGAMHTWPAFVELAEALDREAGL